MEKDLYYKESGTIGTSGPILMIIIGLILAPALAFVYAYATTYIPFVYINGLITYGFGMIMGISMGYVARLTKVRNSAFVGMISLFMGMISLFFAWVFWIYAASEQTYLTFNLMEIIDIAIGAAEIGPWTIFGFAPTGIALYVVWLIEAILLVGAAYLAGMGTKSSVPFCEDCNKWAKPIFTKENLTEGVNKKLIVEKLEEGNLDELFKLGKAKSGVRARSELSILTCPKCEKEYFLTLKEISKVIGGDGEEEEETMLAENLRLPLSQKDQIISWAENVGYISAKKPEELEEKSSEIAK